jgi:hypothetical protein
MTSRVGLRLGRTAVGQMMAVAVLAAAAAKMDDVGLSMR